MGRPAPRRALLKPQWHCGGRRFDPAMLHSTAHCDENLRGGGGPFGGLAPGRAMDWYGNAGHSIANRDTASSFHSSPTPGTSLGIARPSEIASGCERIGAAQSTYSRKWAVGVT